MIQGKIGCRSLGIVVWSKVLPLSTEQWRIRSAFRDQEGFRVVVGKSNFWPSLQILAETLRLGGQMTKSLPQSGLLSLKGPFFVVRSIEKMKIFPKILSFQPLPRRDHFLFLGQKWPFLGHFWSKMAKNDHLWTYGGAFQRLRRFFTFCEIGSGLGIWWTSVWGFGQSWSIFAILWNFSRFLKVKFFTFCDFLIAERGSLRAPFRDRKLLTDRSWWDHDRPVSGFNSGISVHVETCSFWGSKSNFVAFS